jgi:uncharacterized protein YndB with AHSA1/START domain
MVPEKIEREVMVDAPIERVWAVVTEPEHVGAWFGDAGAEIDLRPGGEMTMTWRQHGTVRATVERVEPPHLFAYRWARPMGAVPAVGNTTLVEFMLTAEGGRTRLRVVESGFRELDETEEGKAKYAEGNVKGWRSELDQLLEYVRRVPA